MSDDIQPSAPPTEAPTSSLPARLTPEQWGTIVAVFAGGFVVQIVWTNAELLLPLIQSSFHASTPDVAWVVAGFPIGYALLALPGSVLTLHWGHRRTALTGLIILGASSVLSALAGSVFELIVWRFVGGAGAGLFFAPTAALLSETLPEQMRARLLGLYASSGLGVGGALGFIEGSVLGPPLGWPAVFVLTAGICGAVLLLAIWYLPPHIAPDLTLADRSVRQRASGVLRSRWLWGLTAGFAGLVIAASLSIAYVSTYIVEVHPGWGIGFAGALGSVTLFFTIPGSLLGSRLSDGGSDRRTLAVVFGILFAPIIILLPFLDQAVLVVDYVLGGLIVGAILPLLFAMPSNFRETEGGNTSVAIGVIETSQVLLQGGAAVLFGFIVVSFGFTSAWVIFGLVALAPLPALMLVPSNRATPHSPRAIHS
ncbi:MAG: MFS transporter [Thermoplasmata archaeon]